MAQIFDDSETFAEHAAAPRLVPRRQTPPLGQTHSTMQTGGHLWAARFRKNARVELVGQRVECQPRRVSATIFQSPEVLILVHNVDMHRRSELHTTP